MFPRIQEAAHIDESTQSNPGTLHKVQERLGVVCNFQQSSLRRSYKEGKVAMRKLVSSGSPFEPRIGFSRAVRVGQIVAVSGTAPIALDGSVACPGDVYGQTRRCLEIIGDAVVDARLSFDTVVRTRIMLTDISQWEAAARAHGEFFAAIRPATSFIEVKGFINREWLVEVEADCVADQ
jgi:enamine deaminase RidA (YjgF/YER057c/UK114 family)